MLCVHFYETALMFGKLSVMTAIRKWKHEPEWRGCALAIIAFPFITLVYKGRSELLKYVDFFFSPLNCSVFGA